MDGFVESKILKLLRQILKRKNKWKNLKDLLKELTEIVNELEKGDLSFR